MSDFTRQRLTLARKRIGLTIAALARETELSTRILSAYENGSAEPSAATVRLLADRLQRCVLVRPGTRRDWCARCLRESTGASRLFTSCPPTTCSHRPDVVPGRTSPDLNKQHHPCSTHHCHQPVARNNWRELT